VSTHNNASNSDYFVHANYPGKPIDGQTAAAVLESLERAIILSATEIISLPLCVGWFVSVITGKLWINFRKIYEIYGQGIID